MPGTLKRQYNHKAFKEKRKDPSIFPHPKGQELPGERELLSSLKSHCCGLMQHVVVYYYYYYFQQSPYRPLPALSSQGLTSNTTADVCTHPDCTVDCLSPRLCFQVHPILAKFRVISHQQSDVGNTKGKASNYPKLSEISFWVLRTKQERKIKR